MSMQRDNNTTIPNYLILCLFRDLKNIVRSPYACRATLTAQYVAARGEIKRGLKSFALSVALKRKRALRQTCQAITGILAFTHLISLCAAITSVAG